MKARDKPQLFKAFIPGALLEGYLTLGSAAAAVGIFIDAVNPPRLPLILGKRLYIIRPKRNDNKRRVYAAVSVFPF